MQNDNTPAALRLSEGLGPLPEADMTMPSIQADGPDGAHYYRAQTVRALMAADRERCAVRCDALAMEYLDGRFADLAAELRA